MLLSVFCALSIAEKKSYKPDFYRGGGREYFVFCRTSRGHGLTAVSYTHLQTEFNADNQKIDGALKAMRDLIVSPSVLNVVLDKLRSDINALSARVDKLEER